MHTIFTRLAALILIGVTVCGCQSARIGTPLTAKQAGDDGNAQIEFWHALTDRPIASNDEAFHALLLLLDGKDPATDYAQRTAAMKQRGLVADGFAEPGDAAVRRGTLAVAMARGLKIEGGLIMRHTGASPRYALRELTYLQVFPESSENQTFSGTDFVGIIGKCEDYEKTLIAAHPGGEAAAKRAEQIARLNGLRLAMIEADAAHRQAVAQRDRETELQFVSAPVLGFEAALAEPAKVEKAPVAAAPGDEPLKATVTAVQGLAQYRAKETDAWSPVKVGVVLDQGAEFRTALRSVVVFTTPPGNTVTLDRLGTIKVVDAIKHGGKSHTNLGMKYGVSEVHVEAGGAEHETTIATPGSTLAVRGTTAWVSSSGPSFPDQTRVADGLAHYSTRDGKSYDFAGKGKDSTTNTAAAGPADLALATATFNPTSKAQTASEQQVIQNNQVSVPVLSALGGSTPQEQANNPTVPTEPPPTALAQGSFSLNVKWYDPFTARPNLTIQVFLVTPAGNVVGPTQIDPEGLLQFTGNTTERTANVHDVDGKFHLGTYQVKLVNIDDITANVFAFANVSTPSGSRSIFLTNAVGLELAPGAAVALPLVIDESTAVTPGLSARVVRRGRH